MAAKSKHEITKGLPKEFRELADSAIDHIGSILDNLNARDLVYVSSYVAAVILIYNTEAVIAQPLAPFGIFYDPRKKEEVLKDYPSAIMLPLGYWKIDKSQVKDKFDMSQLLLAMVGAYGLLKIDLSDVGSTISKISAAIKLV